jgi:hypothetical protein
MSAARDLLDDLACRARAVTRGARARLFPFAAPESLHPEVLGQASLSEKFSDCDLDHRRPKIRGNKSSRLHYLALLHQNTPLRQTTRTIPVMLGSGYSSQQLNLRQMLANQNLHICGPIFPNFANTKPLSGRLSGGLNEAAGAALKLSQQWECQRHPRRRSARSEGIDRCSRINNDGDQHDRDTSKGR